MNPKTVAILDSLKDSKTFRETFFWIVNSSGVKVPFIQNPAQFDYYKNKSENDLILKARKIGFSSEIEGDFLFDCMFTQNTNAVTISHTMDDTKIHMHKIQYYIETMGTGNQKIEVSLDTENERELYFPETNSYYWIGSAGATRFGRGRDINRLHGSEVAHWIDQSVLTAVLDALRKSGSRTVLETTACGVGEKFHELWEEAGDPKSGSPWKKHFFGWWRDQLNAIALFQNEKIVLNAEESKIIESIKKEFRVQLNDSQMKWWRTKKAGMADKGLMSQEHPSIPREAFISSGRHVFNIEKLEIMKRRANEPLFIGELDDDTKEIRPMDNPEGELTIWKFPREGKKYLISADPAEGVKDGCWSVAPVFDRTSWEVVAELRLRCDPYSFGKKMAMLGEYYDFALLCPELNNHGHATIAGIQSKNYPHILRTTQLWPDLPEKLGFPTEVRTKETCISAYRNAIEDMSYFENSKVAIQEAMSAVRDPNGRMVSERARTVEGTEKHRLYLDCVMTRCIGLYCLKFFTEDELSEGRRDIQFRGGVGSVVCAPKKGKTGYR